MTSTLPSNPLQYGDDQEEEDYDDDYTSFNNSGTTSLDQSSIPQTLPTPPPQTSNNNNNNDDVMSMSNFCYYQTSVKKSLLLSPPTYTMTFRLTHSTIMSTTNTTKAYVQKKSRNQYADSSLLVRFPYSGDDNIRGIKTRNANNMTPIEMQNENFARVRRNKELHAEHRSFMAKLKNERDERTELEVYSCVVIQRVTRGYLARPETVYVGRIKALRIESNALLNTRLALTHDLVLMTEKVGLPPIPGMTLNSRKMIEMKKLEDKEKDKEDIVNAAIQIQALSRSRIQKKQVDDIRKKFYYNKRNESCLLVQRVWRGKVGRDSFMMLVREEQNKAITRIQARIRSNKGRLACDLRKKALYKEKREHAASTLMQAILRGKYSRRKFCAPSYAKVFEKRKEVMYKVMDKKGLNEISLEAGISSNQKAVGRGLGRKG